MSVNSLLAHAPQFKAVKPLGDRVFVKVDKEVSKSEGGLLLPIATGAKPTSGAIVSMGDVQAVKVGARARSRLSRYPGGSQLPGWRSACGRAVARLGNRQVSCCIQWRFRVKPHPLLR